MGMGRWQRMLARRTPYKNTSISESHFATAKSTIISSFAGEGLPVNEKPRVIARAVRVAAQHGIYQANCLERSLVLRWLLARQGIESEIRFGARKEDGEFEAHAWVECCGVPLNEVRNVHEQFRPFESVPAAVRAE